MAWSVTRKAVTLAHSPLFSRLLFAIACALSLALLTIGGPVGSALHRLVRRPNRPTHTFVHAAGPCRSSRLLGWFLQHPQPIHHVSMFCRRCPTISRYTADQGMLEQQHAACWTALWRSPLTSP